LSRRLEVVWAPTGREPRKRKQTVPIRQVEELGKNHGMGLAF